MNRFRDIRVLDLFCGAGGLSEGFRQAGYNIVAGVDIWDAVADTYRTNQNAKFLTKDITELDAHKLLSTIGDIDVLIGGAPCVKFSKSNMVLDEEDWASVL